MYIIIIITIQIDDVSTVLCRKASWKDEDGAKERMREGEKE
jgi:hypothetical protein